MTFVLGMLIHSIIILFVLPPDSVPWIGLLPGIGILTQHLLEALQGISRGSLSLPLIGHLFSQGIVAAVFEPAIRDFTDEYTEAQAERRLWNARWSWLRS